MEYVRALSRAWTSAQVEQQGRYSISRLRALQAYSEQANIASTIGIVFLTPLPSLLVVALLDIMPLSDPSKALGQQNYAFWVRCFVAPLVFSYIVASHFHRTAPSLPFSPTRHAWIAIVVAATSLPYVYFLSTWVGFPIPFFFQTTALPVFFVLGGLLWISWGSALRVDAVARARLKRHSDLTMVQLCTVPGYAVFIVVYRSLSKPYQQIFILLLAPVKLVIKNLILRCVSHLEDEAPSIIVFNADTLLALFVSLALQSSIDHSSTAVVMLVDLVQASVNLTEVYRLACRIDGFIHTTSIADVGSGVDPITLSCRILDTNTRVSRHYTIVSPWHQRVKSSHILASTTSPFNPSLNSIVPLPTPPIPAIAGPALPASAGLQPMDQTELEIVASTLKMLYLTEFMMLVELIEFIMAFFYAAYLFILSQLHNRAYYAFIKGLSQASLEQMARGAAFYALFELLSLVVMCLLLYRMLRHRAAIHQLGFVVRSCWSVVQSTLVVWVFISVQYNLEHFAQSHQSAHFPTFDIFTAPSIKVPLMPPSNSDPPTIFVVVGVLMAVVVVVGFRVSCVRSCDVVEDRAAAPPSVQTVPAPRSNAFYPHHVVSVDTNYNSMESPVQYDATSIPDAILVSSAPTATLEERAILIQALHPYPLVASAPPPQAIFDTIPLASDPAIITSRLPFDALTLHTLVSTGGYGRVYKGSCRGESVAIKKLLPETRHDLTQINSFFEEIKLMTMLHHDHIIRYVGVAWDALSELSAVTELMDGGDLRTMLTRFQEQDRPQGFDQQKTGLALHIAHALTYMHSLQPVVLHRDLKSKNILLDALQTTAKLTDIGVAREGGANTMTAAIGTVLWMAPEVMAGDRYDEKADVFSFGVVLSELDTHAIPYADAKTKMVSELGRSVPDTALLQRIMSGRVSVTFSTRLHASVRALVQSCVSVEPFKRPTAAQAMYELQKCARDT